MSKVFITHSRAVFGRRLDPEYHYALASISLKSPYPSVKLLSLAYFKTGGTPSTSVDAYWNGALPWISAKDFTAFRFDDSEDHITELAAKEATTYVVDKPALLMVSRSGILQHSLPVMVTYKRAAINQDIKAFFPDSRVSVDYLGAYFDLLGKRLLPLLCKSGATVQSINTNELMNLQVPVPPPDVQRQLVAELDAAYAAKRKADEKAAELLASIDDIVLEALGIPPIPLADTSLVARIFTVSSRDVADERLDAYYHQDYFRTIAKKIAIDDRTMSLGKIGNFVRGVTYSADDEENDGFAVLRANNVSLETGEIDLTDLVHVRRELCFDDAQRICSGDILICAASGSKEHAGKVAYVEDDLGDAFAGGFMTILRVEESVAMPRYVAVYMQSQIFRRLILRHLGGTNINNVSLGMLNALPIIVPSKDEQEEIVAKVTSIRATAKSLKADAQSALVSAKKRIEELILGV